MVSAVVPLEKPRRMKLKTPAGVELVEGKGEGEDEWEGEGTTPARVESVVESEENTIAEVKTVGRRQ